MTSNDSSSSDNTDLIHLTTPMNIQPDTECHVTCIAPIKVELAGGQHLYLSAHTFATLKAPVSMTISPTDRLGPGFARGWNKLPDELKIAILEENLVQEDNYVHWQLFQGPVVCRTLLQHLAMGPDISRLAHEIFYKKNAFLVTVDSTGGAPPKLPPLNVHHLIRGIGVVVHFTPESWTFLQKVAAGLFPNMEEIKIMYTWDKIVPIPTTFFQSLPQMQGIVFACPGRLRVSENTNPHLEPFLRRHGVDTQALTQHVKRLITFANRKVSDTK